MKDTYDQAADILDGPTAGEQGPEHDGFFNPWRLPITSTAQLLVGEITDQLRAYETAQRTRQRRRKAGDQIVFEKTVTALVCDLVHAELTQTNWIAVPRSKGVLARKSRYRSPVFGKQFVNILDLLSSDELGLVEQVIGHWNRFGSGQRTVIAARERLRGRIIELGLTLKDLGIDQKEETIVLRASPKTHSSSGKAISYPETEETSRMRREMEVINERLESADIRLVIDGHEDAGSVQRIRLQRVFTHGSFNSGGRLFGGFWQELPQATRGTALRIDGEETVELDYGQMALRQLYGMAEVTPSFIDGYLIPLPGLEDMSLAFREGFKKLINAMLFSDKPLSRKPKETKKLLPGFLSIQQLTDAVLEAHAPVAHYFHTGIGHHLQFLESELMVELLLSAGEQGITALPIHDSIIVPRSVEGEARRLMEEIFHQRTGLEAMIRVSTD